MATPAAALSALALELMEKLLIRASTLNGSLGIRDRVDALDQSVKLDMIDGLHEKGCTIATEILVLLRAGLADGAFARWRSLYEVEVIAGFIASQSPSTAERYRNHAAVKNWESLQSVSEKSPSLFEAIDATILADFKQKRDDAIWKYGPKFKHEYGWAADVLGEAKRNGPNRGDLEKAIGREEWGPLYKAASYQVHPMANAVTGSMGTGTQGIAMPGIVTVSSLKTLSQVFIDVCVSEVQQPGVKKAIEELADEAGSAFSLLP